jgi:hypothetical protein
MTLPHPRDGLALDGDVALAGPLGDGDATARPRAVRRRALVARRVDGGSSSRGATDGSATGWCACRVALFAIARCCRLRSGFDVSWAEVYRAASDMVYADDAFETTTG